MTSSSRSRVLGVLASVAVLLHSTGCDRTETRTRTASAPVISDQVHNGGTPGFFWLPPIAPAATYGGTFMAGLSPVVEVEALPHDTTRPPVASFTTTSGTGGAAIRSDETTHYGVNWDTKASALDPSITYRIRVVVDGTLLGYADVDVVASGSELRNVTTGEFVPLLDGRTLPIKFRVEPAAVVCLGTTCEPLDQCHAAGTCDPLTGLCSSPEMPSGTACDDGDPCTRNDVCRAGVCAGDTATCPEGDACHDVGFCDRSTGSCVRPSKPDGTLCSDDDLCTEVDTCLAGNCVGSTPVGCDASGPCRDPGVCDPLTGFCSSPASSEGTACDDGNPCTRTDSCLAGECVGGDSVVCGASSACHGIGSCDPATGICSDPILADGTSCNDGDACTLVDRCVAGSCVGSTLLTCTPSDQCHVAGACDPVTGTCSNPPKPDGASCDDGSACPTAARCNAGSCVGGPPDACAQTAASCQECHATVPEFGFPWVDTDQAVPGSSGHSHRWDAPASNPAVGASPPTSAAMASRLDEGTVTCVTCHDDHGSAESFRGTQHVSVTPGVPLARIAGVGTGTLSLDPPAAGAAPRSYLLEIVQGGATAVATFRFSCDEGTSWFGWNGAGWSAGAPAGAPTGTAVALGDGPDVTVSFAGTFLAGDRWASFHIGYPILRVAVEASQQCEDCHSALVQSAADVEAGGDGVRLFSHPVGESLARPYDRTGGSWALLDADGALQAIGDGVATNDLRLDTAGKVRCLTCHAPHNADSNSLTEDAR